MTFERVVAALVRPIRPPKNVSDYERSLLLSSILVLQGLLVLLTLLTNFAEREPDGTLARLLSIGAFFVITFVLYVASRYLHHRIVAWAWMGLTYAIIVGVALLGTAGSQNNTLNYLVPVIIVAILVLSTEEALVFLVVCLVSLPGVSWVRPDADYNVAQQIVFIGFVALLTMLSVLLARIYRARATESEQRYRDLMAANNEGILILDESGEHILDANAAFGRIVGQSSEAIIGQSPIIFLAEGSRQLFLEHHAQREMNALELLIHSEAEKGERYVEVTMKPHVYKRQNAWVLLISDVTDRKIAQQRRIEYERRYDALFRHTADAVFIVTLEGVIMTANERAQDMLACDLAALFGEPINQFFVREGETPLVDMLDLLTHDNAQRPEVVETDILRSDQSTFTGEISAMYVRDANDAPLYIQCMIRDISARRQAQNQKFELALHRERTRLLEDFIVQASHHFRTPMTNIRTSIYLLPKFQHAPDKQQAHFGVLRRELERLQHLIDDLLLVTRLRKDDSDYRMERLSPNGLLDYLQERYQKSDDYGQHRWQWRDYSSADTIIFADRQHLLRAIGNLIDNAVLYTPAGGQITVMAQRHQDWLIFEVRDNGIGIPEDEQEAIFQEFYRSTEARMMHSNRNGLGLTIARQIVESLSGGIYLQSAPGEGAAFQIAIPVFSTFRESLSPLPAAFVNDLQPQSL